MEITLQTIKSAKLANSSNEELGAFNSKLVEQLKKLTELSDQVKNEMKSRFEKVAIKEFGNAKVIIQNRKAFDKVKFEKEGTEGEKQTQITLAEWEDEWKKIEEKYQMQNQIITIR